MKRSSFLFQSEPQQRHGPRPGRSRRRVRSLTPRDGQMGNDEGLEPDEILQLEVGHSRVLRNHVVRPVS